MSQVTRQTETRNTQRDNSAGRRIVGVIFGLIEIILGLRLIFKLLGANPANGFVKAIYDITQFFVGLFEGIFAKVSISSTTKAVFEPATLIAIILVALVAWLVMKLMTPRKIRQVESTEYTNIPASVEQPRTDNQPVNQQVNQPINQPVNQPDNQQNPGIPPDNQQK
jgi:hypothetical protein